MAAETQEPGTDLEAIAQERFGRGHRLNQLHAIRAKLESHTVLSGDEGDYVNAARERYESDPFSELFGSIDTYFKMLELGQISLDDARARITESAELHKTLAELKGIPAKPL